VSALFAARSTKATLAQVFPGTLSIWMKDTLRNMYAALPSQRVPAQTGQQQRERAHVCKQDIKGPADMNGLG